MVTGTVVTMLFIALGNIPMVLVTSPTTGDFMITWCTRAVLPIKSVHRCGVWETLDLECPNF
jgi:hypothetical protein